MINLCFLQAIFGDLRLSAEQQPRTWDFVDGDLRSSHASLGFMRFCWAIAIPNQP